MICGGDEIGRTQRGNNNAYCQNNEVSWFDWQHADEALLAFVVRLIGFRREHAVFQRRRWFAGRALRGENVTEIAWFKPDGVPMTDQDWQTGFARTVGVFLNGQAIPTPDARGEPIVDDSFYILFNAYWEPLRFTLPTCGWGDRWVTVIDTNEPVPDLREQHQHRAGEAMEVEARSMVVLRRVD